MRKGLIFIISGICFMTLSIVLTSTYDIKHNFLDFIILVFTMLPIWVGINFCRKSKSNKKKIKKKAKKRTNQYKIHAKQYSLSSPFFAHFKEHHCPKCSSQLSVRFKSKIINSESPEAQYYDFTNADGYPIRGNVDFRIGIFQCYYCGAEYKIDEIRRIEKEDKKKRKEGERLRK